MNSQSLYNDMENIFKQQNVNDRQELIRKLNSFNRELPDTDIAKIEEAILDVSQQNKNVLELYDVILQITPISLLRYKERGWSYERKNLNKDKITEEEHCQMVANDLDELNNPLWEEAYNYFNDCRKKDSKVLDKSAFRKIWDWNRERWKSPELRKRLAIVTVLHDYGKLTQGEDHPQDSVEVLPSLLNRLNPTLLQQEEIDIIMAEIEQHDCLFALASGENVPKNIKKYFNERSINYRDVLKDLTIIQLLDSTNVKGGVSSEFLKEIVQYASNFDNFTKGTWFNKRLLRILFFEQDKFKLICKGSKVFKGLFKNELVKEAKKALKRLEKQNKDDIGAYQFFQYILENVRFRYALGVFNKHKDNDGKIIKDKIEPLIKLLFYWSQLARNTINAFIFNPNIDPKKYIFNEEDNKEPDEKPEII